jgi:hypothetical protein
MRCVLARGDPSSVLADPKMNFNRLFPLSFKNMQNLVLFGPSTNIKDSKSGYTNATLMNIFK